MNCSICNRPNLGVHNINNRRYCTNCRNERFAKCSCCEEYFDIHRRLGVVLVTGRAGWACPTCFQNDFQECRSCRHYSLRSGFEAVEADGQVYCSACRRETFTCDICDHTLPRRMLYDEHYCVNCYTNEADVIPDHTFQPDHKPRGSGPHYFGVELEVECDEEVMPRVEQAKRIRKVMGDFVITKRDGSLDNGFEIVTVPASFDLQVEMWSKFFGKKFKGLESWNTETCGLHVHCSRQPLSLLTIGKIVIFVNDRQNRDFIETMAGRKLGSYCALKNKTLKHARIPYDRLSHDDRYEAVNLCNRHTIEFRIFKGTLKKESFFKCLEFCDALIRFCNTNYFGLKGCKRVDNFIKYVTLYKKEYPNLFAYICAKWLKQENEMTKRFGFELPKKGEKLKKSREREHREGQNNELDIFVAALPDDENDDIY
jgi:hypothetical protein